MKTQLLQQISLLSVEEQIDLVEAIWDGIEARGEMPAITDDLAAELEGRLADHLAHPEQSLDWNEARAEAGAKFRK